MDHLSALVLGARLLPSSHSRLALGFNRKGGRSGPTGLVGRRRLVAAGRRLTYASLTRVPPLAVLQCSTTSIR